MKKKKTTKTEYRFSSGDKMRISRDITWKMCYKQNFMQDFLLNLTKLLFFRCVLNAIAGQDTVSINQWPLHIYTDPLIYLLATEFVECCNGVVAA